MLSVTAWNCHAIGVCGPTHCSLLGHLAPPRRVPHGTRNLEQNLDQTLPNRRDRRKHYDIPFLFLVVVLRPTSDYLVRVDTLYTLLTLIWYAPELIFFCKKKNF